MNNEVNTKHDPILSSNKNTDASPRYISEKEMKHLATIAKWTKVISITTYIYSALMIIGFIIRFASVGNVEYLGFIAVGIFWLFPTTYLYRASKLYKHIVDNTDDSTLTQGLSNSAKFWKINGVFVIICSIVMVISVVLVSFF